MEISIGFGIVIGGFMFFMAQLIRMMFLTLMQTRKINSERLMALGQQISNEKIARINYGNDWKDEAEKMKDTEESFQKFKEEQERKEREKQGRRGKSKEGEGKARKEREKK